MYKVLEEYVKERKELDPKNSWDGNVPANYKTKDGKALGRWVNRQRSNYGKKKIKKEQIEKLNAIGMKWSVHDRNKYQYSVGAPSTHVVVSSSNSEVSGKQAKASSSSNGVVSSSSSTANNNKEIKAKEVKTVAV